MVIVLVVLLGACSSSRDARPIERPAPPTSASASATTDASAAPTTSSSDTTEPTGPTRVTTDPTTSASSTRVVNGTAVAGSAGAVAETGPPFAQAEPFAEAVRLSDGTCVGWADSQGGSTAGLAVGAAVTILDAEENEEIGSGTIEASRWEDLSDGGEQWNCFFDFTATLTGAPAEFRIRVATLGPWLARPDPTDPETFVASVNSDASIGLIPSCPAIPEPPTSAPSAPSTAPSTTAAATTTTAVQLVGGWNAVGRYWSQGVAALCEAGLPVTAIARPCRPPGVGSEYIAAVVDSADSTVTYADGAEVPIGTEMTVVVATGRPCE